MSIISLKNVGLEFPIFNVADFSLRQSLIKSATGGILKKTTKNTYSVVALKDINMSLKQGDRLGLIGHNGSGKTTLLKVLAGVYRPTSGDILVEGDISTLFNISMGTHGDTTGYESLYVSSLIRGKSPKEAKACLSQMAEFTELGDYLNLPIRTYSAGMRMRVGFAVATEGTPDILLIDEVFGTGDQNFLEKCQQRLVSLIERSGILVFASHSQALIENLCNKVMVLDQGQIVAFGDTKETLRKYNKIL